jgi:SpoU rRNA methylase family enzyme
MQDITQISTSPSANDSSSLEITKNNDIVDSEVVDEDGEVVVITQELRDSFLMDHGKIEGAFWQMAFALSKIKSRKSYLAGGFKSFNEYASKVVPLGVRQAYGYAIVGDRFSDYEKKLLKEDAPNLGIEKAKMIAAQGEEEVHRLMETGEINIGDYLITTDDLENDTIKTLRARISLAEDAKKAAEEKAAKSELLEEKLKNATMEKEELEAFHQENKERVDEEIKMKEMLDDAWHKITQVRKVSQLNLDSVYSAEFGTPRAKDIADSYYRLTTYMEETARFLRTSNIHAVEDYLFMQDDPTDTSEEYEEKVEEILNNAKKRS